MKKKKLNFLCPVAYYYSYHCGGVISAAMRVMLKYSSIA
jgi:hypothetical protein